MKRLIGIVIFLSMVIGVGPIWAQSQTTIAGQDPAKSASINAPLRFNAALNNTTAATSLRYMPVLPCVANAAAPSWTEARLVGLSCTLAGDLRVTGSFTITGNTAVAGTTAHDAAGAAVNPLAIGCYASLLAPTIVNADTDITRGWCTRSGAVVTNPSYDGNLAATNNGAATAGTPRVVIANDNANVPINLSAVNATTISTGVGAAGSGTARVVDVASGTIGLAPPTQGKFNAGIGSGATGGLLIGIAVGDTFVNVDIVTATTTLIITGVSGRHVWITSMALLTSLANNVAIISGTGATCGTGTTSMNGGVTAAEGWNWAANQGIAQGTGLGAINRTNATGDSVCIITSTTGQLSGRIGYAIF